jgi:ribose 1,5-bisphosphokinase
MMGERQVESRQALVLPQHVAQDGAKVGGHLVLMVGVSGAGKDTLFVLARQQLEASDRFVFQPLDITRPRHRASETHQPVSEAEYRRRMEEGFYSLSWWANDCGYGLPRSIEKPLLDGKTVISIGSRAVVPQALAAYPTLRVVLIEASYTVVRQRLERRGRETFDQAERRLKRSAVVPIAGVAVLLVDNDGSLAQAADRIVATLKGLDP